MSTTLVMKTIIRTSELRSILVCSKTAEWTLGSASRSVGESKLPFLNSSSLDHIAHSSVLTVVFDRGNVHQAHLAMPAPHSGPLNLSV